MHQGTLGGPQLYSSLITLVIVVAIVLARNSRPRRLRLEAMWVRPLIFLALIGLMFASTPTPTDVVSVALIVVGLLLGVAAGWMRGSLMHIEVHPETHDISARASPAGLIFILAVLGVRMFIRSAGGASIAGLSAAAITAALIIFAGAMMITQGVEMFLRARRLLGEAKAASVNPGKTPIVS